MAIILIAILLWLILLSRLLYLQYIHFNRYENLSERNTLRTEAIAPSRGLIFDRHGEILAQNKTTYQLQIVPELVKNLDQLLEDIARLVQLPTRNVKQFKRKLNYYPSFASIPLLVQLNEQETATLSVNLYKLKGAQLKPGQIRDYPHGKDVAHLLGYVGRINEQELQTIDRKRYEGTHFIGKLGIEKQYESWLQGSPGQQESQNNALGRSVQQTLKKSSIPGKNVNLTIDLKLQQVALAAMEGKKGAVVAINPKNGEILTLLSMPVFDPNVFVTGFSDSTSQVLYGKEKPLFNRFLQGQYPPASTLKPLLSLAGLHHHFITPKDTIFDPGWYQINEKSKKIRDWQPYGHGKTNLRKAIRESCDTYFYDLAFHMGIDKLSSWLLDFGFGKKTDVDLPGEHSGLVPSRDWKIQTLDKPWYQGETLITMIGQGYLTSTPLQLAQSVGLIANRGHMPKLHLIKGYINEETIELPKPIKSQHWQEIIEGMLEVTSHPHGTAFKVFANSSYSIAGKTGTAQVFGWQGPRRPQHELTEHLRDHSLFVGFAPVEDPQIAIAVIVENEKGSAKVAKDIMDSYMGSISHAS